LPVLFYNKTNDMKKKQETYKFKIKAMILFERIADKPFDIKTNEDLYLYFYCIKLVNDDNYETKFEDFLEWCDNNTNEVKSFLKQLEKHNSRQNDLSKETGTAEGI
jgi:hypothetical protein